MTPANDQESASSGPRDADKTGMGERFAPPNLRLVDVIAARFPPGTLPKHGSPEFDERMHEVMSEIAADLAGIFVAATADPVEALGRFMIMVTDSTRLGMEVKRK